MERARWALQRECAGRVPNIDTLASVRYDTSTQSTIAGVSIGMPLPVFDRNQGNIRRAQAELIDAEQEVQRLELQLRNRLAAAFQRYENARQQVERYSQNVLPTAKESLDLIVAGYRQGEFPYLTLLTAQRTYFRVNLTYLESLRDLRTSTIAIEGLMLSGGLGPEGGSDGTQAPNQALPRTPDCCGGSASKARKSHGYQKPSCRRDDERDPPGSSRRSKIRRSPLRHLIDRSPAHSPPRRTRAVVRETSPVSLAVRPVFVILTWRIRFPLGRHQRRRGALARDLQRPEIASHRLLPMNAARVSSRKSTETINLTRLNRLSRFGRYTRIPSSSYRMEFVTWSVASQQLGFSWPRWCSARLLAWENPLRR